MIVWCSCNFLEIKKTRFVEFDKRLKQKFVYSIIDCIHMKYKLFNHLISLLLFSLVKRNQSNSKAADESKEQYFYQIFNVFSCHLFLIGRMAGLTRSIK